MSFGIKHAIHIYVAYFKWSGYCFAESSDMHWYNHNKQTTHLSMNGSDICVSFKFLAPGKFEWNFRHAIFKQIIVIDGWGISYEIALLWMTLDFTDNQSTFVQVMAWCHRATSHYLSQCWPRSLSPYGVTRPQWVKMVSLKFHTKYLNQTL